MESRSTLLVWMSKAGDEMRRIGARSDGDDGVARMQLAANGEESTHEDLK